MRLRTLDIHPKGRWFTAFILFSMVACHPGSEWIGLSGQIQPAPGRGSQFFLADTTEGQQPESINSEPAIISLPDTASTASSDTTTQSQIPALPTDTLSTAIPDSVTQPTPLPGDSLSVFKPDSSIVDSSIAVMDTLPPPKTLIERLADSLNFVYDSTARIENFKYKKQGTHTIRATDDPDYALFLKAPKLLKKTVEIDSTLEKVVIREFIGQTETRTPIAMDYQRYVQQRYQQNIQRNWDVIVNKRETRQDVDAIEEMLSKITNVDIYVPGGGGGLFRTIFGPPKINIRVNGRIDIKAGWAQSTNSQANAFQGQGTQNDPVFDQQFQMNVQGTVGDKLKINADWSTERTFEYENNLRIVYTGYEDEIIQKIEAGNVSLQTGSKYIGGSAALFGIKSELQLGPLRATFLVSQKKGKTETKNISGGSQETNIEIKASEYDYDKHYFISRYFLNRFEPALQNPPILTSTGAAISDIEVWKGKTTATVNEDERDGVAIIGLGERLDENLLPYVDPTQPYYGIIYDQSGNFALNPSEIEQLKAGTLEVDDANIPSDQVYSGRFIQLKKDVDYVLDPNLGIVHLNIQLTNNEVLAVAYRYQSDAGGTNSVGDFASENASTSDTTTTRLILKMVRPKTLKNTEKYSWDLMLKNIYKLPASDFNEEDLDLDILYDFNNQKQRNIPGATQNLIDMLGMNKVGPNNSPTPDDKFDFIPGFNIIPRRGEIIFPKLRPFASDELETLLQQQNIENIDNYLYSELYDTTYNAAQQDQNAQAKDKYYMIGSVKGAITDRYNLGFNIVEGSVKVTSNNIPLAEGVDYVVDYQLGSVQIKNRAYLTAGSNLAISYESNDLITIASKNILGTRLDYDLNEKTKFGFSWIRYSEKPLTDKVRIGEEPLVNNIIGFDGQYTTEAKWLTRMLNYVPGVRTAAPSEIAVSGEFAQINPGHPSELNTNLDPNGVAYIDDFEGSRRSVTVGLIDNSWSISSAPDSINLSLDRFVDDSTKSTYRSVLRWYQDFGRRISVTDIWPERSVSSRDNNLTPFTLEYFPKRRGAYNYSLDLPRTIYNTNGDTWAGMQKAVPTYITNLVDENIEYIEFWFQVSDNVNSPGNYTDAEGGFMHIDLGYISEDIIPNNRLNTEQGISVENNQFEDVWGRYPRNTQGIATFNTPDDIGLDGLSDADEQVKFASFANHVNSLVAAGVDQDEVNRILNDLSGDNYTYLQGSFNYEGKNGTERNSSGNTGKSSLYPDTEDLNQSTILDTRNDYFQYRIKIAPNELESGKGYIVSSNEISGWYQARIPLDEFYARFGDIKDLTFVEYIRIWFSGFKNPVAFNFATFDFVGNQWLKTEKDSVLSVAVINIEENPDQYDSPPGIERQKDRTRPDEDIRLNEQSLTITVNGLEDGEERSIRKNILRGGFDLTNYERMKMFVHGPDINPPPGYSTVNYVSATNFDAEIFLRFGTDNSNFYEISQPLRPDQRKSSGRVTWNDNNQFDIDLDALTAFKANRVSDTLIVAVGPEDGYPEGTTITIRGNPTLTGVKTFFIGVRNPVGIGTMDPLIFSIWVNELRVTGFKEESGWAANVGTNIKLADVASVGFFIEQKTAEFRRVDEKQSRNKSDNRNWSVRATVQLDKLLTEEPTFNFPISLTHTESISQPKYLSGSDILLEEAAKQVEDAGLDGDALIDLNKSVTISNTFSINQIKKVSKSGNPLLEALVEPFSLDFSFNDKFSRNPQTEWAKSWSWNSRINYTYRFEPDLFIRPFYYPLAFLTWESLWLNQIFNEKDVTNWRENKLYLKPTSFGWNMSLTRSRSQTKQRNQDEIKTPTYAFTTARSFNLGYNLFDDIGFTVTGNIQSTLVELLTDREGFERKETDIFKDIFKQLSQFDLGTDLNYTQNTTFNYKIPFMEWAGLTSSYSANYRWDNSQYSQNIGKSVGWSNAFSVGATLKIKDWFGADKSSASRSPAGRGRAGAKAATAEPDTLAPHERLWEDLKSLGSMVVSFENISIRYSQSNSFSTNGVDGGSGFLNIWPLNQAWWPENLSIYEPGEIRGPDLAFQLGFSKNPGPRIGQDLLGDQADKLIFSERLSTTNSLDLSTGLKPSNNLAIDLKWFVKWNDSEENRLAPGTYEISSQTKSGGFSRSFIALFGKIENIKKNIPTAENGNYIFGNNEVTQGFRDGLEFLQLSGAFQKALGLGIFEISDEVRDLIPLPNWSIRVSGLEGVPLWEGFIRTMALTHTYTSDYNTSYKYPTNAGEEIPDPIDPANKLLVPDREFTNPRISERFAPLVGVNFSFKDWPLSARVNLNTGRSISLSTANYQVTEQKNMEISGSISFRQSGKLLFSFFKDFALKNDIDFSLTGSYSTDETTITSLTGSTSNPPPNGISRITIEPRIGYSISTRVNATAFWRYTQSTPLSSSLTAAEITRSEIGVNVSILIQ